MKIIHRDAQVEDARVTKIYTFEGLKRLEVTEAGAGDIIAIAGMEDVDIGETIADEADPTPLPFVAIEEPTLSMNFLVNKSPFAGLEGKYVTTRHLSERLPRELRSNVSLRIELTDSPDTFKVSGRGELHLAILIETMRREGYRVPGLAPRGDLQAHRRRPVRTDGARHDRRAGRIRRGRDRKPRPPPGRDEEHGRVAREHSSGVLVPARGLIGFRGEFMTQTKGTGMLHHNFHGYEPIKAKWRTGQRGRLSR